MSRLPFLIAPVLIACGFAAAYARPLAHNAGAPAAAHAHMPARVAAAVNPAAPMPGPHIVWATSTLALTPATAAVMTVTGRHFARPVYVRLESADRVLTYGPEALQELTPSRFRLNLSGVEPATYTLSVSNERGDRSNDVTITLREK